MKKSLQLNGVLLVLAGIILLVGGNEFFEPIIEDEYQRCDLCIWEDGIEGPCNCKNITEKTLTIPWWYLILNIIIVIIGLIMMGMGWVYKDES